MRKVILASLAALAVAAPAHAGGGEGEEPKREAKAKPRLLRISGPIVRLSDEAVAVENRVGDAVLTCRIPERMISRLEEYEVGDAVRMFCVRHRGRRAVLLKLMPYKPATRPEKPAQRPAEKPAVEKREALGVVAELGDGAIVVQAREARVACRVPAEKLAKLAGLEVGDTVKIWCVEGVLVGLERPVPVDKPKPEPRPGEDVKMYGRIAALSRESVTVSGDAGSLTCKVPAAFAEKVASRFAVGDAVKMMCRASELTYLEKTP
jgi:hypothetical protein